MPALRQLQLMYALKQPKFINFDLKCLTVSYGLFCTLIIITPVFNARTSFRLFEEVLKNN